MISRDSCKNIFLFVIVILAFSLILPQSVAAKDTPETEAIACDSSSHEAPAKGIGKHVNGFFGFGCCLNYRLTSWILSDKCETRPNLCDFSQEKPLCE